LLIPREKGSFSLIKVFEDFKEAFFKKLL